MALYNIGLIPLTNRRTVGIVKQMQFKSIQSTCVLFCFSTLLAVPFTTIAAPPKAKTVGGIKELPPSTKPLAEKDHIALQSAVTSLEKEIASLKTQLKDKPTLLALLPDVQIYLNALRYPLVYHEAIDVKKIGSLHAAGMERAKQLADGKPGWLTGIAPRGYLSRIDNSVQPYALSVPRNYKPGDKKKYRVDIFCHGRGEDMLEAKMIGDKVPPADDKFIVHPYGRYCCANKFAGEMDVHEILDSLRRQYPIDDDRIVLTGFSMGGGAVWHLSVHYSDQWVATSPGAGFCEIKIYQKLAEKGELEKMPWWEQTLFHWYDAPDYARNLMNVPLIAYAGTEDPQQQSGTIMEKVCADLGFKMQRIWGEKVGHKYEPKAKAELDKRLDEYAAKGRNPAPDHVILETWTLRYNKMFWITADALESHWQRTTIDAKIKAGVVTINSKNTTALTIHFSAGQCPLKGNPTIEIDGDKLSTPAVAADGSWNVVLVKTGGHWVVDPQKKMDVFQLAKRHALQGPIDDAFLDRFIMVRPTGKPMHEATAKWAKEELDHAVLQWHRIFRGEAMVKSDADISENDIASSNLILFGDPASNKILAKIADKLPIKWDNKQIIAAEGRKFDAGTHALIAIYPNPLNPTKYIVLNSGFTFREDANATNSRQIPILPDYAIVDVTTPPNAHSPGKIVNAGFFGEHWELQANDGNKNGK